MTALTARPITAVPITARPITARRIGEGDGPSVRTLLSIALQSTLVPGIATGSGTPTYTRSTVATVTDFEGLVKPVLSGEARFMGARRVENLLTLPFTNTSLWTVQNSATLSSGGDLYFPGLASNEGLICRNISIDATGRRYAARIKIKAKAAGDIGKKIRIYLQQNGPSYNITADNEITLTADYVTYGVKMGAALSGSSTGGIRLMLSQATTPEEVTLTIADAQIEDVTGQSNQNPSEYVSVGVGVGVELVSGGDTASNWVARGANIVEQDGDAVKVTYVNNSGGADLPLSVVAPGYDRANAPYVISGNIKTNGASPVEIKFWDGGSSYVLYGSASTSYTSFSVLLTSYSTIHASSGLYFALMSGTDIVWVKNVSIKSAGHGANASSVKYFTAKNGNTVSSNIVTEATGAAIGASDYFADASGPFGYVAEGARTNLCLWGRDFSNAAWVKTNVTAVKDATGRDGAAAVASTLTATASNGTCRQTVTSASATRTISCDIKRKTGTGTIEMTVDGGSTYTDITSQINGSTWARVQVTQAAVTNPSVGFRIGTSGDAIYVDYFGLESASFASSRIHTTTAAVTRNAGSGSYASSSNITTANGVMVLEWTPPYTGMGTVALWGSYVDASNYTRIIHDGANIVFRRRVSGVNYDATKALTYAAGTTYKIAARISDATGGDVFVAGVKGTNSPNTSALQLGANFSVGHDGNGANHSFAPIRNVKHYDTALTDVQVAAI